MERITAEMARMGVRFTIQAVPENVGMVRDLTDITLFGWGFVPSWRTRD
jgi:hypothetical protein